MMVFFKKVLALFLLTLFLFPTIMEQIHVHEHQDEVHCHESDLHFCTSHHHCSICDLVPFTFDIPNFYAESSVYFHENTTLIYGVKSVEFQSFKFSNSLRGPPVVC